MENWCHVNKISLIIDTINLQNFLILEHCFFVSGFGVSFQKDEEMHHFEQQNDSQQDNNIKSRKCI